MTIVVAGGTGHLGRRLSARLVSDGHEVVVLTRGSARPQDGPRLRHVYWNPDGTAGPWAAEIARADAVVNLTGAGIADRRWTRARKRELAESRLLPTRSLVAAVRQAADRPSVFVQGSAVGFYGAQEGEAIIDESFPPGTDFLGTLAVSWEAEAHPVSALGSRLVILRAGVVLTRDGGLIGRLRLPFRLFAGGPVASGQQYLSWIHIDDWVAMVVWALTTPAVTGALNATAPEPVTNEAFSQALGRALRRPSWLRVPAPVLRLVFGEMAGVVLIRGQRVMPKRALDLGFAFEHPAAAEAVAHVVRARGE